MVSFHAPLSPTGRKTIPSELESLSKKRKLNHEPETQEFSEKPLRVQNMISPTPNTELHLETPLPLEWQRCLDIKSGQIYFYNTRTQKRTSSDPRSSPEPSSPAHMSLDLELNLLCGSMGKNKVGENFTKLNSASTFSSTSNHHPFMNSCARKNNNNNNNSSRGLSRSPSWLTFEGDQQEMVTAVCKKCHMLVMMCRSSPACPNCKFVHSPEQSTPTLFKRRLSLLC